jgi:preprotein translocase subunit SecA
LSLFQASGLAIGSALTITLIARLLISVFHFQEDHLLKEGMDDWELDDWEPEDTDTDLFTPQSSVPKVGRNESCPCNSGKKFKNCCGKSAATGSKSHPICTAPST